jgi:hypothetical protein
LAYKVPVRTIEVEFKDGDLKGLVVQFRANPPIDTYLDLVEMADVAGKSKDLGPVRDLLRAVASMAVVGWNLENGTGPVAPTPENFTAHLSPLDGARLVKHYLASIGALPGPLARRSASGGTSGKRPASSRRRSSPKP